MAVCDANYLFRLVDIGDTGRNSDGGVFANSTLGYAINNNLLSIPDPESLSRHFPPLPYVFVGDEAFQLTEHLMKPYPRAVLGLMERIFNYRLSRARRVIENTFGICAAHFRIFRRPIIAGLETVIRATKAIVALHNFLMKDRAPHDRYCPAGYVDSANKPGDWRKEVTDNLGLTEMVNCGSHNYSSEKI